MTDDSAEYMPWAIALVAMGIALEVMVFMTSLPRYLSGGLTLGVIVVGPAIIGAGLSLPFNRIEAGAIIGIVVGAAMAMYFIVMSV